MDGASKSAVSLAALLLVASAALGLYFGFSRASGTPGGASGEEDYTGAPATSVTAKAASAIPDSAPPPPVPDEAFIRKIAREEAQAAIQPNQHKKAKAAAAQSSDDSDSDDSDSSPDTPAPPPPAPAPTTADAPHP